MQLSFAEHCSVPAICLFTSDDSKSEKKTYLQKGAQGLKTSLFIYHIEMVSPILSEAFHRLLNSANNLQSRFVSFQECASTRARKQMPHKPEKADQQNIQVLSNWEQGPFTD